MARSTCSPPIQSPAAECVRTSTCSAGSCSEGARVAGRRWSASCVTLACISADAHFVGSRLLAVSEDATAAMLMGIRPRPHAGAGLGSSAASAAIGIAGALMAISCPWSPTVGRDLWADGVRHGVLGGFGSVTGAATGGRLPSAWLQALSAYWLGPIYKEVVVYALFAVLRWLPPAGPDGQGMRGERVKIGLPILALALLAYPFVLNDPFYHDIGVAGAAGGDLGVGLEHRRRLCRAGLGRPRHVLRRRRLCPLLVYQHRAWPPVVGVPIGIVLSVLLAA